MKNRKGLSITEVAIGTFLLSLILVPSLHVISNQTKTVNETRDHAQVAFIAQNLIEQCRSYTFDLMEADHHTNEKTKKKTFEYRLLHDESLNKTTMNGITYKVDTSKSGLAPVSNKEASDTSMPSVWLFKLVINYTGQDKKNHMFEVTTAIAQRE